MKKTTTIVLAAITLLIALSSCDDNQQATVLTLSTIHAESYFTTQADQHFADLVEERTDGRVRIDVIAGAQLYDSEGKAYQAIKKGDLDFTRVTPSTMAEDEASLNVFLMPYLFDLPTDSFDQFEAVIFGEIGRDLLSDIDGIAGVEGLAFYDTGFRNFFSKDEITSADWFSDKKIRTLDNKLMKSMITALEAEPAIISGNRLAQAFEDGTIDAAENNLLNYSVRQQAPYYLIDGHLRIPEILIASDAVRDKVGESDWAIIEDCALSTMGWEYKNLASEEAEILAELKADSSVTVTQITSELRKELRAKMNSIYSDYSDECGYLVDRIESITSESN